jgi:hypothetical protein
MCEVNSNLIKKYKLTNGDASNEYAERPLHNP